MSHPWWVFIRERFPLPIYVLMVVGILFSVQLQSQPVSEGANPLVWILSLAGLFLFFFELRLMDEIKDYTKDLTAHPDRPLPRGVLTIDQATGMMRGLWWVMLGLSAVCALLLSLAAGGWYLVVTLWLGLMYREFFIGRWLTDRPILYAASHQIIMLPLVYFVAASHGADALSTLMTSMALAMMFGFFAYEICRKLDPHADRVLLTYLQIYGPKVTFLWLALLLFGGMVASGFAGLGWFLWPIQAALVLFGILMILRPDAYKVVEGVASLSLLLHLWSGAIAAWLRMWF
jgi:4-hydroxybenzoate polyprenyltransferase